MKYKLVTMTVASLILGLYVSTPVLAAEKENTGTQEVVAEVVKTLPSYLKAKSTLYQFIPEKEDINDIKGIYVGNVDKDTNIKAMVSYSDRKIYYRNVDGESSTKHYLYHELGHVLDSYDIFDNYDTPQCGKYSSTPEFDEIFKHEAWKVSAKAREKYFDSKKEECFAELYSIYKACPDYVKKYAPVAYKYMRKCERERFKEIPTSNKAVISEKHDFYVKNNMLSLDKKMQEINGVTMIK